MPQAQADAEMTEKEIRDNMWNIRPCQLYKEEYSDCTSMKARFNQYFIYGDSIDCSSYQHDYKNCQKVEDTQDLQAAAAIIKNETKRRAQRMNDHYSNDTWAKRKTAPKDWSSELPEHLKTQYKNSYLEIKAVEYRNKKSLNPADEERTLCTIM